MPETSNPTVPTRWWRRIKGDVALSLAATALSLCAVVTTVWQTGIMREQLRASVWPRLQIGLKYFTDNASKHFQLRLDNVGVGPAVITGIQVSHRGKPFDSAAGMFHSAMRERQVPRERLNVMENNDPVPEMVVAQQQGMVMLASQGPGPEAADLMRWIQPDLKIAIQYASIYGEVWEVAFPGGRLRRIGWRDDPP